MPARRAIEVRHGDGGGGGGAPRWRMSLMENSFNSFFQSQGADAAAARAVFSEGSLFSPFLFGSFFDPADAFPLWEFESEVLLAALRRGCRTSVDWAETESEYYMRAVIPGGRKCDVEITKDDMKVIDISGLWRGPPPDGRDWRAGRWWEHGFVRRLELPEDANWRNVEAYFDDSEGSLEVKVAKNIYHGDAHPATA